MITLAFAAPIMSAIGQEQIVDSAERVFRVKYGSGETERFVAKYSAKLKTSQYESGHASTWKHPIDDRQCHWNAEGHIVREVCFASRGGEQYCKGALTHVFNFTAGNSGHPFSLSKFSLQGQNCGKAQGAVNETFAAAAETLRTSMPAVIENDQAVLLDQLRAAQKAVSVEPTD